MAVTIDPADLIALRPSLSQEAATALIQGAIPRAAQIAPCILSDDFPDEKAAIAKAIILDALARRVDGSGGIVTQQTAGIFNQSIDASRLANLFTAQERSDLARLCGGQSGAYTINTAPGGPVDEWSAARINGPTGTGPGGL